MGKLDPINGYMAWIRARSVGSAIEKAGEIGAVRLTLQAALGGDDQAGDRLGALRDGYVAGAWAMLKLIDANRGAWDAQAIANMLTQLEGAVGGVDLINLANGWTDTGAADPS